MTGRKTSTMGFTSEAEIAEMICYWLEGEGWEVYKEVQVSGIGIADIVATRCGLVWVIETKTTCGLSVIDQALRWRYYANYISIGIPYNSAINSLGLNIIINQTGLGIIRLKKNSLISEDTEKCFKSCIGEYKEARFGRVKRKWVIKALNENQKKSIAGSCSGGHWTEFKNTVALLVEMVEKHPGISLKTAIGGGVFGEKKLDGLKHHYKTKSSAIICLAKHVESGLIEEIEFRDRKLYRKDSIAK